MLSKSDWQRVIVEWNETSIEYPRYSTLHALLELQVDRTPDEVAVIFGSTELTYRELDQRANQLGRHLVGLGVGPEVIVGVCLERSLELIITLIAILKSGGAYLPLDPTYPHERLAFMMKECETRVIVTQKKFAHALPTGTHQFVILDDQCAEIEQHDLTAPVSTATAENLAYVIYTSGSTGQPKGVAVPHRAVVNLLHWTTTTFPMSRGDVLLQVSPFTFDVSVLEIFATLLSGAKLLVIKHGGQRESDYLLELMLNHSVTVGSFVPSTLRMIIADDRFGLVNKLRLAFCGGEAMPLELMQGFFRSSHAVLVNLYGPTEATVYCTKWVCDRHWRDQDPLIGKPIFNTHVYILDDQKNPVSVNTVGEIYLGGDCLARGYIKRPETTGQRFVTNPFSSDSTSRIYRTGDLGFWKKDGSIAFVGRVDDQINLRGFRIEPGEIESALLRSPAIGEALVICREDSPGNQQLVGYCVAAEGKKIPPVMELRRMLSESLPDYMIPSAFVEIEKIPLNANGKRNRKALPPPSERLNLGEETTIGLPKDLLEQRLIELWQKVLGRKNIGIHDNFFDLGGHSLTAALLINEMERFVYERLPIAVFFQTPTVAELAAYLRKNQDAPTWSSLVPLQPEGVKRPLFVVHGMGGDVFAYLHLARQLAPDRPVYGLQAIGLDGIHPHHDSIETMAEHYADQIRALYPSGPYLLLGYSLGGWIAYAVADQLLKKGGHVALLVVMDTEAEAKISLGMRLQQHLSLHLEQAYCREKGRKNLLGYGLRLVGRKIEKLISRKTQQFNVSTKHKEDVASKEPIYRTSIDYFEAICSGYVPPKSELQIQLLIPSERKQWQTNFWRYYAKRGVAIHHIFEKHDDFIDPDKAPFLADILQRLLAETDGL